MTLSRSIRFWIILPVLIIATVAMLFWLRHTNDAVRAEARERFFEQYSRQQYLMAELVSHTMEELFANYRRNLTLVVSLFEGEEVNRQRAEEVRATLRKIYESLAETPVIDLVVFDSAGTAIAIEPADPYTLGRNYAWRQYYQWAKEKKASGQMYLSPFMRLEGGQHRGDKALIVADGIYDSMGGFLGVVIFTLNFDQLVREQILSIHIGKHGYAWLVDTSNREVLVDPNGKVAGLSFEGAFLPLWPGLYHLLLSMEDGKPGSGWYDYEDPADAHRQVRKLVSYHPIRIEDRLWTVGMATPEREAEELLSTFLQRQEAFATMLLVAILGGASLLLGLLATWNRVLSSQVERHIHTLGETRSRLESTFNELLTAKKVAAVGHLALGLAHEIRNPLAAIQMNMQMIKKKIALSGTLRENFTIVEEEIRRLNGLLKEVLDFARTRPLHLRPTEMGEMVRRLIRLMAERFREEGVETQVLIDAPLELLCDPEQIHQVLLNLFLNAAEAMVMREGEKRITVAATARDGMAVIEVRDTGGGIPLEIQGQLFDPFFTTKAAGGGMGLSILQTIVLRHGGSVIGASRPEGGAVFTVSLPLGGPAENTEEPA